MTLPKLRSTLARRHTRQLENFSISKSQERAALLAKAQLDPGSLTADEVTALADFVAYLLGRMRGLILTPYESEQR
jgi:hypothetical protein